MTMAGCQRAGCTEERRECASGGAEGSSLASVQRATAYLLHNHRREANTNHANQNSQPIRSSLARVLMTLRQRAQAGNIPIKLI